MSELDKILALKEKLNRLLETVRRNGGFSAIDKDLMSTYVRELYELTMSIQVGYLPVITQGNENSPPAVKTYAPKISSDKVEDNPVEEELPQLKENGIKKTLSELYAGRGKNTVNDRFKKQSAEVADKLKQTPIRDLQSYIGLNKRFAFIGTLFNDEEQLYDEAVSKVNSFKSYEEAVNYIKTDLLPKFEWEEDEPLVNEFFTLVMRRYLH